MSVRRRKKAIQKVVKLLNLSTSTNSSESTVALRQAESLIRQYQIAQRELPVFQLCDRSTLYRVSWGSSSPRFAKEETVKTSVDSVYQRRFSEKNYDPDKAYESARTILDDMEPDTFGEQEELFDVAGEEIMSGEPAQDTDLNQEQVQAYDEELNDVADEDVLEAAEEGVVNEEADGQNSSGDKYASSDNVIHARDVFRRDHETFTETLKTQYATSDPRVPFSEDDYWSKVYERLADFDEAKVQADIETLDKQLSTATETLEQKKRCRYEHEQQEIQERSERARIEQSFEEAIERAFQARAKSYEKWETNCTSVRMARLKEEQEAIQGHEAVTNELEKTKESYKQHLQRKEDYRAAKIMHELRRQLVLAVSAGEEATSSYEQVIEIMETNGLSLRDLEFSDIKNKSLFIRLLERESALITDIQEREKHTEDMLDKFLASSLTKKDARTSENPIQHVQRLLVAASEGGQFEAHKNLEQVIYLMEANDLGVRDIGYGFIKKYSVFIRLVNWEAERISSLTQREQFTAEILEEYIQHSVKKPNSDDKKATR